MFYQKTISCSLAISMVFSGVYANASNSEPAEAGANNFSMSKKTKIGCGIGVGVAIAVAVATYAANDYSKTHRIDIAGYDTSNWRNRYELLTPGEKISSDAYGNLYVSGPADSRFIYPKEWNRTNSQNSDVKLNKKFINRVMERRFAHLQQCIYYIKLYEDAIRKHIKENGLNEKDVWDPEAVREFNDFMDNLVKILNARPAAIPDLKFSDKLYKNSWAQIQKNQSAHRRVSYKIIKGNKNEKLMLVSDEKTDRVLAAFETLARDSDRLNMILELFRATVGLKSTPQNNWDDAYRVCKDRLEEKYHELISSSKLSNPYRTLYTYKKSFI